MGSPDPEPIDGRPELLWRTSADAIKAKKPSEHSTDDESVVRTKSLPALDRKLRQAHAAAFEDFEGFHADDGPPGLPHQIRVRKPSALNVQNKLAEGIFVGPHSSQSRRVKTKAAPAEAATTRTAVHILMPDEQASSTESNANRRKLSATLQVVRSRDSVYEVIWEDSLTLQPVEDAEPDLTVAAQAESLLGVKQVNTKLAAWSWGFDPTQIYVYEGSPDQPTTVSANSGKAQHAHNTDSSSSTKPSWQPTFDSGSSDEPSPLLEADTMTQRRRSSAPAVIVEPTANVIESIPHEVAPSPPNVTASKRRKLLGNRKDSNAPNEDEHFKDHRDSLMLAHERIFHDDSFVGTANSRADKGKKVRVAPETRVESLKRSTWTKPLPKADVPAVNDHADAAELQDTRLINSIATKVRTPNRASLSEPEAHDGWLRLSAEESGPVAVPEAARDLRTTSDVKEGSQQPFLVLNTPVHTPVRHQAESSDKRSEPATASTAASRARQADNRRSDKPSRKSLAPQSTQSGRRGSVRHEDRFPASSSG